MVLVREATAWVGSGAGGAGGSGSSKDAENKFPVAGGASGAGAGAASGSLSESNAAPTVEITLNQHGPRATRPKNAQHRDHTLTICAATRP